MKLLAVLGLSLVLASSAALPVLAEGPGRSDGHEAPEGSENRTKDHQEERGPTAIGAFAPTPSDHTISGAFVSFSYSTSGVQGFTVNGTRVFDLAVTPAGAPDGRIVVESHGAQVQLRAPTFELQVHDNPEAVTQIEAKDGSVTLSLASGGQVTKTDDESVTFAVGDLVGRARGDGITVSGATIRADERLLVFVEAPRGGFDVKRHDIGDAIGKGHVGAEGSFNENGSRVKEDVVSYGNVTMRTVRAEHGNVTVQVEGHGTEGRVLVLNIDRALLGADDAGKLHITLDNATVDEESDLAALLDPDADGIRPVYHIIFDPSSDAFQVLVRVPHYSVHTLSVTSLTELVTPSVVIGVVAGVALLVPSALVLFRRKSE